MKPKFAKKIFYKSLSCILDTMIWSKKPSHASAPLSCVSCDEAGGVGELNCDPVTMEQVYSVYDTLNTKIQQTLLPAETISSSPERDSNAR
jgi:hypothetical protein